MGTVGIRAMSYWLPDTVFSLEQLEEQDLLNSPVALLRSFGFERVHIAQKGETQEVAARRAAESLFREYEIDPLSIDIFLLAGAFSSDEPSSAKSKELIETFRYSAGKLQYELGMSRAVAMSVGQQGCAALISALRIATSLLRNREATNILCVSADVLPREAKREALYNVISDGACAVLLTQGHPEFEPLAFRQVTKGYYWNTAKLRDEIIASYFPTAKNTISDLLKDTELQVKDIALFIPHNISRRSWEILLDLLDIPAERAFLDNIALHGHAIGADIIINLKDALQVRALERGSPVVLFNFGFGANWSAMAVRL